MANILVIDDVELVLKTTERVLSNAGHAVTCETRGRKAIALLEQTSFDLVITDILMPDMDGTEIVLQLRQDFPELPVIAMSGGGRGNAALYLETAREFGAKAILEKPIAADDLLAAVEACLG